MKYDVIWLDFNRKVYYFLIDSNFLYLYEPQNFLMQNYFSDELIISSIFLF